MRLRDIVNQLEIIEYETENIFLLGIDFNAGQIARAALKLRARLVNMIEIEMRVAQRMHEITGFQIAHLRQHLRQQRIGSNIERHAKENISRTFKTLDRKSS